MSNQDFATTLVEWLERRGHDQVSRALRREAGLSGGRLNPLVKLEEFQGHLNKDINRKLVSFRNDSYASAFESEKNEKKRKNMSRGDGDDDDDQEDGDESRDDNKRQRSTYDGTHNGPTYAPGNKSSRLFLGNLAFKITEAKIESFFADCGSIVNIHWVTDKNSGQFYGTAFIEFDSEEAAEKAMSKNGKKCMERPMKINYCGHKAEVAEKRAEAGDSAQRKMPPAPKWSEKPEDCKALFMGNLSFDVKEEQVRTFFGHCGSIYEVRWGYRDDGEFKGIGWIEFEEEDALQKAVKLHGKALAGRPVRLDYA